MSDLKVETDLKHPINSISKSLDDLGAWLFFGLTGGAYLLKTDFNILETKDVIETYWLAVGYNVLLVVIPLALIFILAQCVHNGNNDIPL